MLLFIAEVDRAKHILKAEFNVTLSRILNQNVKEVLIQIGFFDLCGLKAPNLRQERFGEQVRHWQFATGERVDDDTNRAFDAIEGRITPEARKGIWRGLSEALINSVQHAYAEPRGTIGPDIPSKRWWMFTQEREGKLTVAVCDLGIGIPRSLPLNWSQNLLAQLLAKLPLQGGPDVSALRVALQVGQSSTGEAHRGKGLPEIWQAVRSSPGSGILILSNKARLAWNADEDKEFEAEFEDSIFGTLVMWSVKTAS